VSSGLRRVAKRVNRALGRQAPPSAPWVVAEAQPAVPEPLETFKLFAIVCAWMESDVIAATVANALAQGCDAVYLVDNDSPDDTVAQAVGAGAILAERFSTERFEEQLRFDIMNRVVADVSASDGSDHIWWLWIDADEFPHGPRGLTVREYLASLDRRYRIVGSRFINHFPDSEPAYLSGFHPLEFQPLCEEHLVRVCKLQHRKHSLQRFDRLGNPIECGLGIHGATSADRPLVETTEAVYLHHFPYRAPDFTRHRLATLCGTDEHGRTRVHDGDTAVDGMVPRFETLEAVYAGEWSRVRNYRFEDDHSVANPKPWSDIAPPEDRVFKRWYSAEALETARNPAS